MAKLIGMSSDFKGREYPLKPGETTIGRKADNMVYLDHPTISSHHCRVLVEDGACILQDLGSTNGTRVNAHDAQEVELHDKDLIQFGSIEFILDAPEFAGGDSRFAEGDAELATSALETPQDFVTISPFGEPPREKPGIWIAMLAVFGVLALLAAVAFLALLLF